MTTRHFARTMNVDVRIVIYVDAAGVPLANILTAANTYTGGTTISAGTLQIGSGATGSVR